MSLKIEQFLHPVVLGELEGWIVEKMETRRSCHGKRDTGRFATRPPGTLLSSLFTASRSYIVVLVQWWIVPDFVDRSPLRDAANSDPNDKQSITKGRRGDPAPLCLCHQNSFDGSCMNL